MHPINPNASYDAAPMVERIVVAIATTGRRAILAETVAKIAGQDRLPDLVLISIADETDVDRAGLEDLPFAVQVLSGPKGLTRQRNTILAALRPGDVVLFIDDDFLMSPDFLRETQRIFVENPDVVMVTGTVLADGIGGAGFDHTLGERLLADGRARRGAPKTLTPIFNGYGCNMALRADPTLRHGLRFDETLPLYGWLEDVDLSRQLAPHGRIAKAGSLTGVHLGTKTGRGKGVALGYSQIANPIYLIRKGTYSTRRATRLMGGNILANLAKSMKPEPWIDRRGRLRGNLIAMRDLLTGRLSPEKAAALR